MGVDKLFLARMPHDDIIYDLILLVTNGSLLEGRKMKSHKPTDLLLISKIHKTHLLHLLILQDRVSEHQAGLRYQVEDHELLSTSITLYLQQCQNNLRIHDKLTLLSTHPDNTSPCRTCRSHLNCRSHSALSAGVWFHGSSLRKPISHLYFQR